MPETGFLITSEQIIYLCGFVAAVWGVYKIIKELRKPSDDLRDKVEKHERLLDNDNKRIHKIEESNQLILRCMLDLINHAITGNGIEKMKETRDVLQEAAYILHGLFLFAKSTCSFMRKTYLLKED